MSPFVLDRVTIAMMKDRDQKSMVRKGEELVYFAYTFILMFIVK